MTYDNDYGTSCLSKLTSLNPTALEQLKGCRSVAYQLTVEAMMNYTVSTLVELQPQITIF